MSNSIFFRHHLSDEEVDQVADLMLDRERLEWMAKHYAAFQPSDMQMCVIYWDHSKAGWLETKLHDNWRDAIDEAMQALGGQQDE